MALSACGGRVIDDGLESVPEPDFAPQADDELFVHWHDETQPPPETHVYREDNNGCLRGVVWAERLTEEQIQEGFCVDTLVIRVRRNERFVMPTLEQVQGDLRIYGDGARQIRLPSVKRVQGDVLIESTSRDPNYPDIANILDLSGLRLVDKGVFLSGGKVTSLNLQNLEHVGSDFVAEGLRGLDSLRFPSLLTIAAELQVTDTTLTSLSAPVLQSVGQIVATDNPLLPQCDVDTIADDTMGEVSAENNGGACAN
jgi:hypothetical protein